jgi:hypothetical protein
VCFSFPAAAAVTVTATAADAFARDLCAMAAEKAPEN